MTEQAGLWTTRVTRLVGIHDWHARAMQHHSNWSVRLGIGRLRARSAEMAGNGAECLHRLGNSKLHQVNVCQVILQPQQQT